MPDITFHFIIVVLSTMSKISITLLIDSYKKLNYCCICKYDKFYGTYKQLR